MKLLAFSRTAICPAFQPRALMPALLQQKWRFLPEAQGFLGGQASILFWCQFQAKDQGFWGPSSTTQKGCQGPASRSPGDSQGQSLKNIVFSAAAP